MEANEANCIVGAVAGAVAGIQKRCTTRHVGELRVEHGTLSHTLYRAVLEYGQFGGDVIHGVGSVIQPIVKLFLRLTVVAVVVASRRVAA